MPRVLSAFLLLAAAACAEFRFVHPGLLHTRADLERMREKVAAGIEPWKSGFEALRAHPQSQAGYSVQGPFPEIGRAPNLRSREFDQDANAAYQNVMMWQVTGDRAHAEKSMQILDAWCSTLERVTGADAVLMAGLGPFKMVNAAEILRWADSGWPEESARRCEGMFRRAIYPALKDFALFANGNWDTAAVKMVVAIGVYSNDRDMFERGLRYYVSGSGNGRLTHYIFESGQSQESGRDQTHTQLGLGHLGDTCEIAWNQGLDLYGYADNRLLKGFEYTARYNLGGSVPFTLVVDRTGKYRHKAISGAQTGRLRPIFEQIYNHFVKRRGIAAPETERAAAAIRPEGPAHNADHPGFGTILFSLPTGPASRDAAPPAAPAGLVASAGDERIALSWVAPVGAEGYTVRRRSAKERAFRVVSRSVRQARFTDSNVKRGVLYQYSVSAMNRAGASPESAAVTVSAGLPAPWRGPAAFDGRSFTIEGSGDEYHLAYAPMKASGTITARLVPPVASQFAAIGLTIRETHAAESPHASLLLSPVATDARERPRWRAQFVTHASDGGESRIVASGPAIAEPHVRYGRLMEPYWLRLARTGDRITATVSPDGSSWTVIGGTTIPWKGQALAGLSVASGIAGVSTSVSFDNVRYQ